jgi:hypothetical protein
MLLFLARDAVDGRTGQSSIRIRYPLLALRSPSTGMLLTLLKPPRAREQGPSGPRQSEGGRGPSARNPPGAWTSATRPRPARRGEQREADAGVSASTARRAERGAPVRFRTGRKVAGIPGPRAISRSGPPADARVVGRRETAGPGYPCRVSRSATKGGRNELHPHRHAPFSSVGVAGTRRSARTFHAL